MTALMRFGIAAAAASLTLSHAPLAAQDAVAISPAQQADDAVGPAQLKDFNLNGTVLRRADPQPERAAPAPTRQQPPVEARVSRTDPAATPSQQEPVRTAERPRQPDTASDQAKRRTAQVQSSPQAPATTRSAAASLDLPPPSPAAPLFTAPPYPEPAQSTNFAPAQAVQDTGGFSPLPWIAVALLLGVGAFFYFRRQNGGLALAGGPEISEFSAPEREPVRAQPRPAPAPAPGPPARPAVPAAPAGIVSTRLRPALEAQFAPDRLAVEADRVMLEFQLAVTNSGSGPARDVLVEAALFNAGPDQDREIMAFFERPVGQGERVPLIAPLKSMVFRSAVSMPRDRVRQFKAGDRTVFVPLIGFNLLYRWSGGDAQTSVSYLVGIDRRSDRLAPFRIDDTPRIVPSLGARPLDTTLQR